VGVRTAELQASSVFWVQQGLRMVELGVTEGVLGTEGFLLPENQTLDTKDEIEVVPGSGWWWAGWSLLSVLGLILNITFLVVVVRGRKERDLRSLLTAVLITISVIDLLDILRIIPSIVLNLHTFVEFRISFCSIGIFHSLSLSFLLSFLGFFLVCPCRDSPPIYYPNSTCNGSLPQKILIPLSLLVSAGISAILYLFPNAYESIVDEEGLVPHSCIDYTSLIGLIQDEDPTEKETFWSEVFQVIVGILSVLLPLLVIPVAIIVSCLQAAARGLCCQAKYKQSAGEILVVLLLLITYLASLTASLLPSFATALSFSIAPFSSAPVLWELSNASLRPTIYFLCNPAVWEAAKHCCGNSKRSYGSVSTREDEVALAPVVERVSSL